MTAFRVSRCTGWTDPTTRSPSRKTNLRTNGDAASSLYLCPVCPNTTSNERMKALGFSVLIGYCSPSGKKQFPNQAAPISESERIQGAQQRVIPSLSTGTTDQILRPIRRSVEITIVTLFAMLTIAVFAQVVARYVFNQPPAWTEELARFCQVWIILLASSICLRKRSHLAVDYLGPAMAPAARRAVAVITGCLIVIYSAVVMVWGVRLLMTGLVQTSPAMQLNMGLVYLVFPIAGGLMLLESILSTLQRARDSEGS